VAAPSQSPPSTWSGRARRCPFGTTPSLGRPSCPPPSPASSGCGSACWWGKRHRWRAAPPVLQARCGSGAPPRLLTSLSQLSSPAWEELSRGRALSGAELSPSDPILRAAAPSFRAPPRRPPAARRGVPGMSNQLLYGDPYTGIKRAASLADLKWHARNTSTHVPADVHFSALNLIWCKAGRLASSYKRGDRGACVRGANCVANKRCWPPFPSLIPSVF
jgi:hypothetical protein